MNNKLSNKLKKMLAAFLITGVIVGSGCGFADDKTSYLDDLFRYNTVVINNDCYNNYDFTRDWTEFGRTIQKYDEIDNIYVKCGRYYEPSKWYSVLKDGKASKENEVEFRLVLDKVESNENFEKILKKLMEDKCNSVKEETFIHEGYKDQLDTIEFERERFNAIIAEKPELKEYSYILTYLDDYELKLEEIKNILIKFYEKKSDIIKFLDEGSFQFDYEYSVIGDYFLENNGHDYDSSEYLRSIGEFIMHNGTYVGQTGLEKLTEYLTGLEKEYKKFDELMSKEGEKVSENK